MEKLLINPYDKECMKMAMLKHEETFKQQVYELHRLYRMQTILMKSINQSNQMPNREIQARWDANSIDYIHHHPPPTHDLQRVEDDHVAESEREEVLEVGIEDESEIQLTLGPTSYHRRKKGETPRTSDNSGGASFSSSSTGSCSRMIRRTTNSGKILREDFTGHQWGISMAHNGRRNSFGKVDHDIDQLLLNQDRSRVVLKQQPSWLFQPLPLKFRT